MATPWGDSAMRKALSLRVLDAEKYLETPVGVHHGQQVTRNILPRPG